MYFLTNVTFRANCFNRNHSHDNPGPCGMSSWIARHDCYYCGKWERNDQPYPCGHYARGSMNSEIKRINALKG